jgi:hypothetical protein
LTRDSDPPEEPTWPQVVATTIRLWVRRNVLPPRPYTSARIRVYRAGAFLVAVLVLAAGLAVAIAKYDGNPSPPVAQSSPDPVSSAAVSLTPASTPTPSPTLTTPADPPLGPAEDSRQLAATWVTHQVSHGTIVACDQLTCNALVHDGYPPSSLDALGTGSSDPLGSQIVVATATVRDLLGSRLAQVYAPAVLASWGSGPSLVEVRVVAAGGAAEYRADERTDLHQRRVAGAQLAGNPRIHATTAAIAELDSGQVDSRLLITLAALTGKINVQIAGFGDAGPGLGSSGPLRLLIVIAPTTTFMYHMLAFMTMQQPPLRPIAWKRHLDGQYLVEIEFKAPSILGLLNTSGT